MTREQERFLWERSCFLLGCIRTVMEGCCPSESFYIFLEWKLGPLDVVLLRILDIMIFVRRKCELYLK